MGKNDPFNLLNSSQTLQNTDPSFPAGSDHAAAPGFHNTPGTAKARTGRIGAYMNLFQASSTGAAAAVTRGGFAAAFLKGRRACQHTCWFVAGPFSIQSTGHKMSWYILLFFLVLVKQLCQLTRNVGAQFPRRFPVGGLRKHPDLPPVLARTQQYHTAVAAHDNALPGAFL